MTTLLNNLWLQKIELKEGGVNSNNDQPQPSQSNKGDSKLNW